MVGWSCSRLWFVGVFGCLIYFSIKDDKLNLRVKKFVFLGIKKNLKGYKLWYSENKKIVWSKYVIFDEISLLKSIMSQQAERMKTKNVLQRVKIDATPLSPIFLILVGISPVIISGGDYVALLDTEQIDLIASK